jgi:hypothetical protein
MIVELRQYTLVPGRRDELIELFEREFVTGQEAAGITLLGLFRDLGDPDRFVWLRGFPDLAARATALAAFYGGPVWRKHRDAANATMIDSDDVLLLRPVGDAPPFAGDPSPVAEGSPAGAQGRVELTVCLGAAPFGDEFVAFFESRVRPLLASAGAAPRAVFRTDYATNNFPALPIREGEHAFVWLTHGTPGAGQPVAAGDAMRRLAADPQWRDEVAPVLRSALLGVPRQVMLAPTRRSTVR